jgi:two-component system phosphate regulon sensor histidine kinase PhoR
MRPRKLLWNVFWGNSVLMAVVLGVCVWLILGEFDRFHNDALSEQLRSVAAVLRADVEPRFNDGNTESLATLVERVSSASKDRLRITFIAVDGTVLADSEADPAGMQSHEDRPEVIEALRTGSGESTRYSKTLLRELRYVAVRIGPADAPQGVVRVAMTVSTIGASAQSVRRLVLAIALAALVAALVFALELAQLWSRPITRITAFARRLSEGDLSARVDASGSDEVAVLAQSLNQMRDRLTQQLQVKADFVANASHELRTPLSAIRASIETLLKMDLNADTPSAKRFLEVIARHGARLEAMVEDLLHLSTLESSSARFAPSAIKLRDVIDETQARCTDLMTSKGLCWEVEIASDCETVVANRQLLRLVLDNLVDNAGKFTDHGGHIHVGARRNNGSVDIEVRDDGCGIDKQEQSRVFERFYQVDRARTGPSRGTGLGLSIVRHAVVAMHGTVRLDSTVGKGTHVKVTLPLNASQE